MSYQDNLKKKINEKSAIIGIVGVGYVGLPLCLEFSAAGFSVIGIDIDELKISKLNQKESYINYISSTRLQNTLGDRFFATSDFSEATRADILIITVPTPLCADKKTPDLSCIQNVMDSLLPHLKKGQMISLESTTYPGTTQELISSRLQAKGFLIGEDFFVLYSPEREDPARVDFSFSDIPKVCAGKTASCLSLGELLYQNIVKKVVPVSSLECAEMTKLLENIHRAVNIALVNEMKVISDKMGIDISEVINAAATKPFGFTPYYPGIGVGGHCIPIDPHYLIYKAKEIGVDPYVVKTATKVNASMPLYTVSQIKAALMKKGKEIKGTKILIKGIAYKKNVDDLRESPALIIMEELERLGASVDYFDANIPSYKNKKSIPLTTNTNTHYDFILNSYSVAESFV